MKLSTAVCRTLTVLILGLGLQDVAFEFGEMTDLYCCAFFQHRGPGLLAQSHRSAPLHLGGSGGCHRLQHLLQEGRENADRYCVHGRIRKATTKTMVLLRGAP